MILYDCEIKRAIESDKSKRFPFFSYVDNWTDYVGMGISCICAYDYETSESRVFCDDNFDSFKALVERTDYVCGFNNHNFDDNLCNAHGLTIPKEKSKDVLQMIWASLGLGCEFKRGTHAGYSLEAMVKTNCPDIKLKQFSGAMAPICYQTGKMGSVIDYCLHDVHMLKQLVNHIRLNGFLISPKNPALRILIDF